MIIFDTDNSGENIPAVCNIKETKKMKQPKPKKQKRNKPKKQRRAKAKKPVVPISLADKRRIAEMKAKNDIAIRDSINRKVAEKNKAKGKATKQRAPRRNQIEMEIYRLRLEQNTLHRNMITKGKGGRKTARRRIRQIETKINELYNENIEYKKLQKQGLINNQYANLFRKMPAGQFNSPQELQNALSGWSKMIKQNAQFRCAVCGSTHDVQAHHIKPKSQYPEDALNPANGICLCKEHHLAAYEGSIHQQHGVNYTEVQFWTWFDNITKEDD